MPELVFTLNGAPVTVDDDGASLLEVLRDRLGVTSAKDGCSPQGQCGCCTVLVDGQPRVSCVTPASRVRGRDVVSVDGLDPAVRDRWADALVACGGTQCGFCTPGIVVRLAALEAKAPLDERGVGQALLAHLCRCTGWRTITDAAMATEPVSAPRSFEGASRRASIEGRAPQRVDPAIALGGGGFADDTAPRDALVAVPSGDGWAIGATLTEARRNAGKVQGRRTTAALRWPLELPEGDWDVTLRTTWVEPAYLEPDASWCEPGGEPVTRLANGGAFGGKADHDLGAVARRLADEHGRPVRVLLSREDVVRRGPKRPPIAAGLRRDGSGIVRVGAASGIAEAIRAVLPDVRIEEVEFAGPPLSASLRAAGWAEAAVLRCALGGAPDAVTSPEGATASAIVDPDGTVRVTVDCGAPLDEIVVRSYCIGAAHMALGWVRSEAITVDEAGEPLDLTMRSFGVLRAVDTPPIEVTIAPSGGEPVNGSDAVFAAVAAAAWRALGHPTDWPTAR